MMKRLGLSITVSKASQEWVGQMSRVPSQNPSAGTTPKSEGVSKSFGGTRALDAVSFLVPAGEVHALVGENGAGKSTLIKIPGGALARNVLQEVALDPAITYHTSA